jgi:hypothetical protein
MNNYLAQFQRDRLPDPQAYFESQELVLSKHGKWRSTECVFHGGSDSMRICLVPPGAWVCMAGCGARGGDILAYHMAINGMSFAEAAKDLGAWVDDGSPARHIRPRPLQAIDALSITANESILIAIAACNVVKGVVLTDDDRERLLTAASRIVHVRELFPS